MKKIFIIILFFMCINFVQAKELNVKFSNCVDGDTAKFIYKDEEITARFLAIDTPETVHPSKEEEKFGKEASDYTCKRIKEAKKIVLEYDEDSDKTDKYGRYLVWVFVDDSLLQEELISKGYASVAYLYGNYKYTEKLEQAEQIAEDNKLGIWATEDTTIEINKNEENKLISFIEQYKEYIILLGALFMVSIFNLKSKNKIKNNLKRKIKKDILNKMKKD